MCMNSRKKTFFFPEVTNSKNILWSLDRSFFRQLQFLQDLYSGKLHREFHYGPDKETSSDAPQLDAKEAVVAGKEAEDKLRMAQNEVKCVVFFGTFIVDEQKIIRKNVRKIFRTFLFSGFFLQIHTDEDDDAVKKRPKRTAKDPPPSQFQHLGPSKNRYTLLHDEF